MRYIWIIVLLQWAASVGLACAQVDVRVAEVEDRRWSDLVNPDARGAFWDNTLTIKLYISGADIAAARLCGALKSVAAADDLGTELKMKPTVPGNVPGVGERFIPALFARAVNSSKAATDPTAPRRDVEVQISLTSPPRRASEIQSIHGEFTILAGGTEEAIDVANVKSAIGGAMPNARLQSLGLELTAVSAADTGTLSPAKVFLQPGQVRLLGIQVNAANANILQSMEIVDGGKVVAKESISSTAKGVRTTYFDGSGPLTDSAALRVHVLSGTSAVRVPIDISHIRLP
jgi:hypothetical protein